MWNGSDFERLLFILVSLVGAVTDYIFYTAFFYSSDNIKIFSLQLDKFTADKF